MNAVQQQAEKDKAYIIELCSNYTAIKEQDSEKDKLFRKLIRGAIKQQIESTYKLFSDCGEDFKAWKDSIRKRTEKLNAGVIVDMALSQYQDKSFIWVK